jgi:hypothetical protein
VRSRIRSRSNSARAAKTWNTSLPPGVVVSIASCRLRNPIPRSARLVTVSTRCRSDLPSRSSFQTTRLSPGPQLVQDLGEDWPVGAGAAGGLGEDPVAAGALEGVDPYLPVALAGWQREAFPSARVQVLDGSGHWPFADDPERTERLVLQFLGEVIGGRPTRGGRSARTARVSRETRGKQAGSHARRHRLPRPNLPRRSGS